MLILTRTLKSTLCLIIGLCSVHALADDGSIDFNKVLLQDKRVIAYKAQLEKNKKCVEQEFSDAFPWDVALMKEKLKLIEQCLNGQCVDELKGVPNKEMKQFLTEENGYFNSLDPKISTLIDTQLNCDGFPGKRGISARVGLIKENNQTTIRVLEVQLMSQRQK